MKRLLLIVNPVAGKLRLKGALMDIIKIYCEAGYEVVTQVTLHRSHGTELAATAKERGFDLVVCCGGDGTLNEAVSGIIKSGSDIKLGYIPCGSTNDFAETLNLAISPEQAAYNTVHGSETKLDTGCFNDSRYFNYIASFGAFTETSYNVSQNIKNKLGHLAYILGGIRDIADLQSYYVKIEADRFQTEGEYIFGAISNTTSVAGIVKLSSDLVNLQDGLFEVLMVKNPKDIYDMNEIMNGIAFSDFSSPLFVFEKAADIHLTMPKEVCWSLDGEAANGGKEVHIVNIQQGITLCK